MSHKKKVALGLALCLPWIATSEPADLYQATAAADKKDYARAFELFRELAEIGNGHAQENLAVLYVNGEGVARDNVLGYAWAKLALENGGGEAARSIVAQLEPHLKEASRARVAEVHARFGNDALRARLLPDPARPPLARPHPCGMKVPANPDDFYPSKAKIQGITGQVMVEARVGSDGSVRTPRALYSFPAEVFEEAGRAVALRSSYTPWIENGVHKPCTIRFKVKFAINDSDKMRPPAEALRIVADLRKKAHAGDPDSQLTYGLASTLRPEFSDAADKDVDWFLKAAQAGVPAAQFLIGNRLLSSNYRPEDRAKGVRWLEMGASGGSGAAMTALASHLLAVGQDAEARDQGFDWMRRAADTRHREGKYLFATLLVSWPDASRRDPARALALLDQIGDSFDYDPLSFEIRAAALAATGDFPAAIRAQTKALSLARKLHWDTRIPEARLQAYEQGRLVEQELVSF
jgi:hypothetical protein